jgi:hypothetical protein
MPQTSGMMAKPVLVDSYRQCACTPSLVSAEMFVQIGLFDFLFPKMKLHLPPCYFLGVPEIQEQSLTILQAIPSNKSLQYVKQGQKQQTCYIKLEGDHFG